MVDLRLKAGRCFSSFNIYFNLVETLAAAGEPPAELMLDSTHAKAHRCVAGAKGGRTPTP